MLSISQCKKFLKSDYQDNEIEEIIDVSYQLATVLVYDFIEKSVSRLQN